MGEILPLAPTTPLNTRKQRRELSSLLTLYLLYPPALSHPHTLSALSCPQAHSSPPTTPPSAQLPRAQCPGAVRGGDSPRTPPLSKERAIRPRRASTQKVIHASTDDWCQLGHLARGSRAAPPEPISPTTQSSRSEAAPCTSHGWPLACRQPAWHRRSTSSASR